MVKSTLTVQPKPKATDMRKSAMIPGSPDVNMSPGWLNNRLEQFSGIGSMIGNWEEMERREEEEDGRDNNDIERGRRRSSKKMNEQAGAELCQA